MDEILLLCLLGDTGRDTHTLPHPGVQHRIPVNCTGTESTDPSDTIYTKRAVDTEAKGNKLSLSTPQFTSKPFPSLGQW